MAGARLHPRACARLLTRYDLRTGLIARRRSSCMTSSTKRKATVTRKSRAPARKAAASKRRTVARIPSVIPMISYEDGIAALEWLANAFGFRETARVAGPDRRLSHGELQAGDGLIMLASPTPDYQSPKRHRDVCEQARKWSSVPWIIDGVLVYVDDTRCTLQTSKGSRCEDLV